MSDSAPRYDGESEQTYWFRQGVEYAEKCSPTAEQLKQAGAVRVEVIDGTAYERPRSPYKLTDGHYWLVPLPTKGKP